MDLATPNVAVFFNAGEAAAAAALMLASLSMNPPLPAIHKVNACHALDLRAYKTLWAYAFTSEAHRYAYALPRE
jgi:hypothetical protein